MRSKHRTKTAIRQIEAQEGSLISEDQEKADMLNNYFASVFQKQEAESLPELVDRQFKQEDNTVDIIVEKISKAIDRMNPFKSQGLNNIHPMLIKECKKLNYYP